MTSPTLSIALSIEPSGRLTLFFPLGKHTSSSLQYALRRAAGGVVCNARGHATRHKTSIEKASRNPHQIHSALTLCKPIAALFTMRSAQSERSKGSNNNNRTL